MESIIHTSVKVSFYVGLFFFLSIAAFEPAVHASSDDDCQLCHADEDLTNPAGRSVYVNWNQYRKSIHGDAGITCTDCHQDLSGIDDFPHAYPLKPAECGFCHEDVQRVYSLSTHGKLLHDGVANAPTCLACHGESHAITAGKSSHEVCINCHQQVVSMLESTAHGKVQKICTDCHGTHGLKPLITGDDEKCRTCHAKQGDAHAAGPHGIARAAGDERAPGCIDCHGGMHNISKLADAKDACHHCHPGIVEEIAVSVHGGLFDSGQGPSSVCYKCHTGHQVYQQKGQNRATCGGCHEQVEKNYEKSLHGYALATGVAKSPDCTGCHDKHRILGKDDPESMIARQNIHRTCGRCHGEESVLAEGLIRLPRAAMTYIESVHGQAIIHGQERAATCPDCHGDHSLKGAADPTSEINTNNIASTCGKCHPGIEKEYQGSIHGRALAVGITDSPTCTGCHGEHQILSPHNPESPTSPSHQAEETCARCHNDPTLIDKYGIEGTVVKTYEDSYHGLAVRGRSKRAATCSDCHNSHDVQPKGDSTSTVHVLNVVQTCGKCHENANLNFALSYTHASLGRLESPVNAFVRNLYIFVLIFIIGGMVLHNLLILNWHILRARKIQARGQTLTRFDTMQIIQHLVLTVSFVGLAVTGFALKFPEVWWVKILSSLGMAEEIRGDLHRIFAVFLIAFGLFHIGYIIFSKRGRKELYALMPTLRDVADVRDSLLFHVFLGKRKPDFGEYDYSQKGEYWALVWGTVIMAITGFILWFPVTFLSFLPGWTVEVAQTVHYYEAWLATLAIVVWHFFFVIFHPEMYPMSWTWLTGKMNVQDIKKHHSRWYKELVEKGVIKPDKTQDKGT